MKIHALLPALTLLVTASVPVGRAATLSLAGTATPGSQYVDYFSNAYAQIDFEPDGMYDLTDNHLYNSGFDVFPNEQLFSLGTLTYDDSLLTGIGAESAPVQDLSLDVNTSVVINWGTYITTLSGLSGTVAFQDGVFTGLSLTSGVTLTLTSAPFTGLSYTGGTLSITGTDFDLDVEETPTAYPLHLKWDISGSDVRPVPEPASVGLLSFTALTLLVRRRRPAGA